MFSKLLEDKMDMVDMLLWRWPGDERVVSVNKDKVVATKDTVHEELEGLWCGFQTQWLEEEFKEAKRSDNSCVWNVFFVQRNMMKAMYEDYLREESFAILESDDVLNVG